MLGYEDEGKMKMENATHTVDGVNDKRRLRPNLGPRLVCLLAHKGKLGIRRREARRDHFLDCLVDLCDDVDGYQNATKCQPTMQHVREITSLSRTVELCPRANVSWVCGENRASGLVSHEHQLIVDGLEVDVRHCDKYVAICEPRFPLSSPSFCELSYLILL